MAWISSPFRIKHGPTTLVDYEDFLTGWMQITGGKIAPLVPLVKGTGQKVFPQGNRWHRIELAWAKTYDTPDLAHKAELSFPASIPDTRDSITIRIEDGTTYTLANGGFDGWAMRAEGHVCYFSLNANGGTLT